MENPIKMDDLDNDLEVPLFQETSISPLSLFLRKTSSVLQRIIHNYVHISIIDSDLQCGSSVQYSLP